MEIKNVKRIVFDLSIALPLFYYLYFIEGYVPTYKLEPFVLGVMLPIFIRLIVWAKDGYKND